MVGKYERIRRLCCPRGDCPEGSPRNPTVQELASNRLSPEPGWVRQIPEAEVVAVQKVRQLKERLRRLRSRLRQPLAPKRVILRDKLAFMLGVVVCMYCPSWSSHSLSAGHIA